ncbi:MAG: hypothetical protein V2A70_02175 [Candidatus Omnitrophota bacterium]
MDNIADDKDLGPQPLDLMMTQLGLSNADLVHASTEQVSFKMVQKARRGRRLSRSVQQKILRALQSAAKSDVYSLQGLFNY